MKRAGRNPWILLLTSSALLALTGCAASIPPIPVDHLLRGDLESMGAFWRQQLDEGDANSRALFLNGVGEVELLRGGDLTAARRDLLEAGRIMGNWSTSGGEVLGAILGAESSKTWQGDPYEKVMNAFYTGILYWFGGEPDNARACFKMGILADAESAEGAAQVDCALLYWLAGRMSLLMGLDEDAKSFFDEAREARRFAVQHGAAGSADNPVLADPAHGNLVCLLSLGIGPRKVASGPHGSVAAIAPRANSVDYAEVYVGERSLGRSSLLMDVDYQAATRGGRAIDGILEGKAVFKDVSEVAAIVLINEGLRDRGAGRNDKLLIGAGLLALSWLTSAAADTRCWETLPRSVHALQADLEPGEHELRIVFFDVYGRDLPALDQTWLVDVPDVGVAAYHFRSLPGVHHE